MTTYGLTSTGFVPKTIEVIRAELNAAWQAQFGASTDVSDSSPDGQMLGIFAEREQQLWALAQQLASSRSRDSATGVSLEDIGAITGCDRAPAERSTVTLTLVGDPLTVVPAGSQASAATTGGPTFETLEDATIATLAAWASTTAYVVGDRRTNGGKAYEVITAGTSAGSGGPLTTAADITDGTVHWTWLGSDTGAVDADARATVTGPLVAVARDVTEIETPVSGWASVINLLDADEGSNVETDALYRVRQEEELSAAGTSTHDAVRADLLQVDGVTSVHLFINDTDTTDGEGVPPHAIEALVQGGDDQDIFDALLASVAAGIKTHGTQTGSAVDSEGFSRVVKFSRPVDVLIYVDVVLEYDASTYGGGSQSAGDLLVKTAIASLDDNPIPGKNGVASKCGALAFGVTGVNDVSDVDIDDAAAPPNGTTVQISSRQVARYDTSRITVTSSSGTP